MSDWRAAAESAYYAKLGEYSWLESVLYHPTNSVLWKSCTIMLEGIYLPLLGFLGVLFTISLAVLSIQTSLGAIRGGETLRRFCWIVGGAFVVAIIPQIMAFLTSSTGAGISSLSCPTS